jgi:ribokinase
VSRILVVGNATLDIVQRVERLPVVGETLLGEAPARCPGGKGLNQAIVAARAGAHVDLVVAVGDDDAAEGLRAALAGETLAVDWIVVDAPTDLSVIWVDAAGRNMIVSSAACAHALTVSAATTAAARLAVGDWLLLQGNLSAAASLAAVEAARLRGARVALNAAPIAFDFAPILPLCDLLIVNEVEAAMLAGIADPRDAARRLARAAPVVLTLGAAGAYLLAGNETMIPAPRVAAVDSAGAGDVLAGTLVALLSQGVALPAALGVAVEAASLAVTRAGTSVSFPTRAEIDGLRAARHV